MRNGCGEAGDSMRRELSPRFDTVGTTYVLVVHVIFDAFVFMVIVYRAHRSAADLPARTVVLRADDDRADATAAVA